MCKPSAENLLLNQLIVNNVKLSERSSYFIARFLLYVRSGVGYIICMSLELFVKDTVLLFQHVVLLISYAVTDNFEVFVVFHLNLSCFNDISRYPFDPSLTLSVKCLEVLVTQEEHKTCVIKHTSISFSILSFVNSIFNIS